MREKINKIIFFSLLVGIGYAVFVEAMYHLIAGNVPPFIIVYIVADFALIVFSASKVDAQVMQIMQIE